MPDHPEPVLPAAEELTVPPGKPNLAQLAMGLFALLLAAAGVILIAIVDMPTEKAVMVASFVGAAVQWAGSVVSYHFGSSAGSAAKMRDLPCDVALAI